MSEGFLHVTSETGVLKRVMLHRPGAEMEYLMPRQLGDMLFEDIPWVARMRVEHDDFAAALRKSGAEVVYIEDYIRCILAEREIAEQFIDEAFAEELGGERAEMRRIKEIFLSSDAAERTAFAIAGISPRDINALPESLADFFPQETDYWLKPLPNMYFTRDPGAVIGGGIVLCSMNTPARRREAQLLRLVALHHPDFAGTPVIFNNAEYRMPIEGGDILVLSERAVAIGCSQRTGLHAIDYVASKLLGERSAVQSVLAVQIPPERAFMHLDTVMTMVDPASFIVYPRILDEVSVVEISRGREGRLQYRCHDELRGALASALGLDEVRILLSGGGDRLIAAREQWNDAANTLAVAPGRVLVYNRNSVSNQGLREHGIETIEIEGSELVRGRGGPRCMSMPLYREDIR
ncbi:MAG: arginine deiminase [Bacillota bacterium]|nr:arginine deiminase [Bacillota bacterium]